MATAGFKVVVVGSGGALLMLDDFPPTTYSV